MESIGTPIMWSVFIALVIAALVIDLLVLKQSGPHKVGMREAGLWSVCWIGLALLFNAGLWWYLKGSVGDAEANRIGLEFLTGYLVEKALAVDNIFVFLMIFGYFAIPPQHQQRALIWGVVGAIALRAVMIFIGAALIAQFHWVLYFFGAFLVFTGFKMLWAAGQQSDLNDNPILKWLRGHLRVTEKHHGGKLSVIEDGKRFFTPMFLVMVMIAFTDVIFAVDSIPAIFAITTDPFIVLTSNVFAVLGLRALYFLLAGMADRFHLLAYGLALVLVFIGTKMLIVDFLKIPIGISLGVVALLIASAMVLSLWIKPRSDDDELGEVK